MSDPFSLDPHQSALLVMDYQKVLLENYLPEDQAAKVLASTANLIGAARAGGMSVIYVTVAFRRGHPEVSGRNRLFTLLKDSGLFSREAADTAIHPAVAPLGDEPVVIKHRIGAFAGTDMETLLRSSGVDTLVLVGITTAGVVLSTVRQAFDKDYRLVVASDCCADPDQDVHRMLLDKVIAQHAEVLPAESIIEALSACSWLDTGAGTKTH
jgi:nicotinamidase-related amidase